jgi:hypothetical protein
MSVNESIHLARDYKFISKENNEKIDYIFNSLVAFHTCH